MLVDDRTRAKWRVAAWINAALLLLALGYLGALSYPATEAVRLRNALLLDIAAPTDVDWTPASMPPTFEQERRTASQALTSVVGDLGYTGTTGDWAIALSLAERLTRNARDIDAIQGNLLDTYKAIVLDGRGYCADFTKVYLALAHIAGLTAREWGFSFDGFGGQGHAVVEIFDRQRGRWILLDVYNNVHFVEHRTGEPLSARQLQDALAKPYSALGVRKNGAGRLGYLDSEKLIAYYRRGSSEWYLWASNAVFSYEANPWVRAASGFGPAIQQLVAIAGGVHPRIKVVPTARNIGGLNRMQSLRSSLILLAVTVLFLCLLFIYVLRKLARVTRISGVSSCLALKER